MSNKAVVLQGLAQMNERPDEAAHSLREFQHSARVLSNNQPRLIDQYPDQWVAVSGTTVIAHDEALEDLLRKVDAEDLRRSDVIVRFGSRH